MFQESDSLPYTLKYCIASDGGKTEEPYERVEGSNKAMV
jgi:hypothetical protein